MGDLWENDLQNAKTLVRSANEYAALYTSQADKSQSLKYITIIRAKVASLKRTINNLEMLLVEYDSSDSNLSLQHKRRHDLDELIYSFRSLELMLKNSATDNSFSPTQQSSTRLTPLDVNNLTSSEFSYYRDTMFKIQDDELDLLDNSASAIKNISTNIRDEVNLHTKLLGDVTDSMEYADTFVNRNRERFNDIILRSNKRQLMFIIIALVFILILLVIF